jgi:hypothetical protein
LVVLWRAVLGGQWHGALHAEVRHAQQGVAGGASRLGGEGPALLVEGLDRAIEQAVGATEGGRRRVGPPFDVLDGQLGLGTAALVRQLEVPRLHRSRARDQVADRAGDLEQLGE